VKDLVAKEDSAAAEIKTATENLVQSTMKLGEAIYKASQAQGSAEAPSDAGSSGATDSGNSGEKVVDAEYEEVKNDKKDS